MVVLSSTHIVAPVLSVRSGDCPWKRIFFILDVVLCRAPCAFFSLGLRFSFFFFSSEATLLQAGPASDAAISSLDMCDKFSFVSSVQPSFVAILASRTDYRSDVARLSPISIATLGLV